MAWRRTVALLRRASVLVLVASRAQAQSSAPPIGTIDLYGLQTIADSTVRRSVGLAPGAALPDSTSKAAILARLRAIPNVQDAALTAVCCDTTGHTILFVGIAEHGAPAPTFRAPPSGSERLPAEILARDSVFQERLMDAVRAGRNAEVDSGGHQFFADSALNAIQHGYLAFAATRVPLLRRILANSSRAEERALAAELLGYAPDIRAVIPDFIAAIRDPSGEVRNAAMRALWVIAAYGQKEPSAGIRVPADPFADMLWSLTWTDRNKSSAALWQLTASRDSVLLATLRARALRPLIDVARWADPGHAVPGFVVLGRIQGRTDQEIFSAFRRNDRRAILDEAERMLRPRRGEYQEKE